MIQRVIFKSPCAQQTVLEIVTLEELVPKNHPLLRIEDVVDFSIIHEIAAPHYLTALGLPNHPIFWIRAFNLLGLNRYEITHGKRVGGIHEQT